METTDNRSPLYYRLYKEIKKNIVDGTYKKGDKIPSERELCDIYNLSRMTVRLAIDELVKQGFLIKVQGKGTFILSQSINQNLNKVYSFSHEMKKQGRISKTTIVKQELIEPDLNILYNLGLEDGSKVVFVERLRYEKDNVLMLERTYFPYPEYKFLLNCDLSQGLYKTLNGEFGISVNRAIETFKACQLSPYAREMLETAETFGLKVKRTSYHDEKIVCYSIIVAKGDSVEFTVQLNS